ncbi:unnamed protein product, partial [Brenthis ino]
MPETRQIDTPSQADARRCFLIFPAKSTEHVTQLVAVLKGEEYINRQRADGCRTPQVVFPSGFERIHGSSTDYSWNSQLLPQGDADSGLLPGIDRRVTAADVTGARGYDIVIDCSDSI